jgi:hypothetical protein
MHGKGKNEHHHTPEILSEVKFMRTHRAQQQCQPHGSFSVQWHSHLSMLLKKICIESSLHPGQGP